MPGQSRDNPGDKVRSQKVTYPFLIFRINLLKITNTNLSDL